MLYKLVSGGANQIQKFTQRVTQLLQEGWLLSGNIVVTGRGTLYRELVKEEPSDTASELLSSPEQLIGFAELDAIDQAFRVNYERLLSQSLRDLLDINGITLSCQRGTFCTTYKGETTAGISPTHVLGLLKSSKHYPIDSDGAQFLRELESLV